MVDIKTKDWNWIYWEALKTHYGLDKNKKRYDKGYQKLIIEKWQKVDQQKKQWSTKNNTED